MVLVANEARLGNETSFSWRIPFFYTMDDYSWRKGKTIHIQFFISRYPRTRKPSWFLPHLDATAYCSVRTGLWNACRKHTQKPIWRLQMMVSKGKLLFQIPLFVFGDVTVTIQLVHFDKPRKTGERLQQCFLLPFSTLQNWPSRDDLE